MRVGRKILILFCVLCIVPLFALYAGFTDEFVAFFQPLIQPTATILGGVYISVIVFLYLVSIHLNDSFSWLLDYNKKGTRFDRTTTRLGHIMSQPRFDVLFTPAQQWIPPLYRIISFVAWILLATLYASFVAMQLSYPFQDQFSMMFIFVLFFGGGMALTLLINESVLEDTIEQVEERMMR